MWYTSLADNAKLLFILYIKKLGNLSLVRSLVCSSTRRNFLLKRLYIAYLLLIISYTIFVVITQNVTLSHYVPLEMTDSIVIDASSELLDSIQQLPPELQPHLSSMMYRPRLPIVLYWQSYFVKEYKMFVPKNVTNCPYRCIHTTDRRVGSEAAVRVFHERTFNTADLPPPNQYAYNVLHTLEPPFFTYSKYDKKMKPMPDYFNVTSSYRTSSAIYYPYDRFVERTGNEKADEIWTQNQVKERIEAKRKPLLIAVSNCKAHSSREKYVRALQSYLNITVVGRCPFANANCKPFSTKEALHYDQTCMKDKIAEHYFYLAFENSVCPEYLTEKFWRVKHLIVPIVLSRGVMPPHIPNDTYIAASDFESPKHLADYLQHLMDTPSEYAKYFKWTQKYRKTSLSESEVRVSCQLCKLAYLGKPIRIADYKKYWSVDECPANYSINLINNSKDDPGNSEKWEQKLTELMKRTYRDRNLDRIL